MIEGVRTRRIALGPWGINVRLSARRAHAVRTSLPYRAVVRPLVDALDELAQRGRQWTGPLPEGVQDTPGARELYRQVMAVPQWYHSIDLPWGIATPGGFDHRSLVDHYHLPGSLDGKRVLDVATVDGFWAFQLEARGAREVIGIDLDSWTDLDLPAPVKAEFVRVGAWQSFGAGFRVAKRALASHVRRRVINVYNLSPARVGTFDFLFCGDLLLHLLSPRRALERIRSVSRGEAIFADVYDPELDDVPGQPVTRYLGGWNTCAWWLPSQSCLVQMIKDAGFSQAEVIHTFTAAQVGGEPLHRAIIRARA